MKLYRSLVKVPMGWFLNASPIKPNRLSQLKNLKKVRMMSLYAKSPWEKSKFWKTWSIPMLSSWGMLSEGRESFIWFLSMLKIISLKCYKKVLRGCNLSSSKILFTKLLKGLCTCILTTSYIETLSLKIYLFRRTSNLKFAISVSQDPTKSKEKIIQTM
jgi:hypothetical protein